MDTNILQYMYLHPIMTATVAQWVRALAPQAEGLVFESPQNSRMRRKTPNKQNKIKQIEAFKDQIIYFTW